MSPIVAPANKIPLRWENPTRQPQVSIQVLRSRIRILMDTLIEELWLPMSLRSLVAEECANMQQLLEDGAGNLETVASKAHMIAFFLYTHDKAVKDSETAAQLRILDLELDNAFTSGYDAANSRRNLGVA